MVSRVDVGEYYRRYEAGEFNGVRVELFDGEVRPEIKPTPQRAVAISTTNAAFFRAFDGDAVLGTRLPVRLDEFCELGPDISLKRGEIEDYSLNHPTPVDILLLLDVADALTCNDIFVKTSVYARTGIVEYWIVNIPERQLEVHRGPQRDSAMPFGWGYSVRLIVPESGRVATLWKPDVEFAVADLLPRATSE